MPDGGISEEAIGAAIFDALDAVGAAAWTAAGIAEVAAIAASAYMSYESGVRARNAYNNSLRDRYVMQRTASGQRALVLGRARVSGPIAFMQSYGSNQTTLAIVVVLAAHECDAIESVYFNDQQVILDSAGNVTGILNTEHFSVNSSTPLLVMLSVAAQATTIVATAEYEDATIILSTSLNSDSLHLTLTGARATGVADVKVTYQPQVCQYTPTQVLDQVTRITATATTGSYSFPAGSTVYSPVVGPRGVTGSLIGGAISATSVVVVQTLSGKQTALATTFVVDSLGHATSVSWVGATVGATVQITYQASYNFSRARIRKYLGTAGQAADAIMVANLPGEWTTNHVGNGLCYVVCEFDYDPSSFSAGLPNVSAVLRGAKLYDPRTALTAWTQNPAVLARGYWTHAIGANQSAASCDDTSIIAAANVCDPGATYNVGIFSYGRPLYQAGYVATKDMKPQDVLTDLCNAMGGRWVINGNKLRVKAGAYTAPVAAIDASWLTGESSVTVTPLPPRQSLFNTVQGTFCDETNDFRAVLYPKQTATALVTPDGRELDLDITYNAVTNSGQAQYLAACAIRYNRAGMTISIACNLRAFPLEVFDVVTLTLPRFGFVAQTFEVTDTSFTPEGLVLLSLKYINATIWMMDASYSATAYAPKTALPSPWDVGVPVLGTPQTGTAQLLKQADGTIVSRIYVPLTMDDVSVINSGFIDVSYLDAGDTTGSWNTVSVSGDSLAVYLAPVQDGHTYLLKARGRNPLANGAWCTSISCLVLGQSAPPTAVSGVLYPIINGQVVFSWTPNPDADYKQTVIQYGPVGTTGNAWGGVGMVQAFAGNASTFTWATLVAGAYEFQIRHYNWSGVPSASYTAVVAAPNALTNGVNATLTLSTVALPSDAAGNVTSFVTAATTISIYVNGADDTANWTVTPSTSTGMTSGGSRPTFTITALSAAYDTGTLTLTCTKAGFPTVTKTFTVSKAKAGATGSAGATGATGAAGATGAPGTAGIQSAAARVYQWAASIPAGPSGAATYTWLTGAFGTAPAGWSLTSGTTPSPGFTLWAASVAITDVASSPSTGFNWTSAGIMAVGYAGLTGAAGATGATGAAGTNGANGTTGASAVVAYALVGLGGSPAGTPNPDTVAGNNLPAVNTWGMGETWTTTVPAYSAGQVVYQTNGVYSPTSGNTVWSLPYISALKVGSLSAISANLGSITAGDIQGVTGTFSGTLTAAAVNAVNTINLAGQAVTIPVSVFVPGPVTISGTAQIASASIISTGAPIEISCGASFLGFAGNGTSYAATLYLYCDGSLLFSSVVCYCSGLPTSGTNVYGGGCLPPYSHTPGAGSHTYVLKASGINSCTNTGMFLIETKK